jgi:hypothetical protein
MSFAFRGRRARTSCRAQPSPLAIRHPNSMGHLIPISRLNYYWHSASLRACSSRSFQADLRNKISFCKGRKNFPKKSLSRSAIDATMPTTSKSSSRVRRAGTRPLEPLPWTYGWSTARLSKVGRDETTIALYHNEQTASGVLADALWTL